VSPRPAQPPRVELLEDRCLPATAANLNQAFLAQAYQDLLQRPIDDAGQAAWSTVLDQGVSRSTVATGIETSPSREFWTDQVEGLYNRFLGRPPDQQALSANLAALASGATLEQVATMITGSAEYFQNRGGGTNDGFVSALFQDALGRGVDPGAQSAFDQALAAGTDRSQLTGMVFGSTEYLQNQVQGWYRQYLHRDAEPATLTQGASMLASGARDEQLIAAIVGSDEYFGRLSGSSTTGSTTTVTSSANPATVGQAVTFTASVSAASGTATPGGTVTFLDGTNTLGTANVGANGQAAFTTSALTTGTHTIIANYSGDQNFQASSGSLTQTINAATTTAATTTTVTASPSPSLFGQAVTFTATVTPPTAGNSTPTGSVAFTDESGTALGTATLNASGVATLTTSTLAVGTHTVTAAYGGDSTFTASSGTASQTVNASTTTMALTSSANPSVFGQSITLTAAVTANSAGAGTPTGSVTFTDTTTGATLGTGTLGANGQATITTSSLAVGTHALTASYPGGGNFAGSDGSLTQTVTQASTSTALAASPNPSPFGQAVQLTVTVAAMAPGVGTPTGSVTITDTTTGTVLNTAPLDATGKATFTTSSLTMGSHALTASYAGDSNFTGSSGSVTQTVNPAATLTQLTSSANPSATGQAVMLTAAVTPAVSGTGTPTGTVTFTDTTTGVTLGTPTLDGSGRASITTSALTVGSHGIVAAYSGDPNFATSNATLPQTVTQAATTTDVASSLNPSALGQSATFTATVRVTAPGAGTPTGTVTFTDTTTGTTLGTPTLDASGHASVQTAALGQGPHTITASYASDGSFEASSGSVDQTVS
jgi:hypothetical protein